MFQRYQRFSLVAITVLAGLLGSRAGESSQPAYFLERSQSGTFNLRVMSWNVGLGSIFPPDGVRHESFARIVKAVNPDVVCLQEIGPRQPIHELTGMMDRLLPLKDGLQWQSHRATNMDNVVLSRYPLSQHAQEAVIPRPLPQLQMPEFHMGQVMCLVRLPDSPGLQGVYVIATHFMSASDDASIQDRQRHADSIVRWLRRLKEGGYPGSLPAGTPIIILGDLNVYESAPLDAAHHLTTLLTGNIVDEASFGPDIQPDWNGSYLSDVKPRHNGREKDWYTWRIDDQRFAPGALDRILYTDSVMKVANSFVLNTTAMTEEELSRSGLLATDVLKGAKPGHFDHLPLVADFILVPKQAVKPRPAHADGPLPSWNDTAPKQAIVSFVERVTQAGSPDFVPAAERIAVFDNDGTLWAEQPMPFQIFFIFDRVKALASQHPEWRTNEPFASVLRDDAKAALAGGEKALLELAMATRAGLTTEESEKAIVDWLATARHPQTGRLYTEMVYQPMLELLSYLRANGFKTFIVSGGGLEFMRAFSERVYGIPPEQVVGTSFKTNYEIRGGKPAIIHLPELNFMNDKAGKPLAIQQHIGRRPLMAFGSSDGDFQMLEWTTAGSGPRFGLIVHHTDATREWAYDRQSHVGKLDQGLNEANARGWTVVNIKDDWKEVFGFVAGGTGTAKLALPKE